MNITTLGPFAGLANRQGWPAWKARTIAIEAALVTNVIILGLGWLLRGGVPRATIGDDTQAIGVIPVILVTLVVGLVAWGLLALLERATARAKTLWTTIALIVLVLSLTGPLGSGVDASSKAILACMHLGAAATIIPLMRASDRPA